MILLGCLVLVILLGILIASKNWTDDPQLFGAILMVFGFGLLIISTLMIPIYHMKIKSEIKMFEETRKTYERIRMKDNTTIESAAIQVDIARENRWLAEKIYWNGTVFDIWIPDEVMSLKPIE